MKPETVKLDIYTRVTNQILEYLEAGVRPWAKPWDAQYAACRIVMPLRHNGTPYRGVNVLLLWCVAVSQGYSSPYWMTYKQATELGAQVRKGEKGSLVVYADTLSKTEADENGEEQERLIPYMKGYTVFNVAQIEGLPERYNFNPEPVLDPLPRLEQAERFFAATGVQIRHGGNMAYYAPSPDYIQMPPFEAFRDAESYAGTLAHELTHWTSHKSRLDRKFEGNQRFGGEAYAKEELVAELGAAFLCAELGIASDIRDDHAAYIGHWLKTLQSDKRFIFTAASHAQRAADYLQSLQGT